MAVDKVEMDSAGSVEHRPAPAPGSVWKKRVIGASIVLVIALVILDTFTTRFTLEAVEAFLKWVAREPVLGGMAFIVVYIVATIAFVPGSILTLGAGFVFTEALGRGLGFVVGTLIVWIGASIGACAAFLLGRYVLRDWVHEKLVARFPVVHTIDRVLEGQGLKILLLLRLSPAIPFNAFNYVASVTGAKFPAYALACFGMLPGTAGFVFIGSALSDIKDVIEGNTGGGGSEGVVRFVILGVGIVATVVAVVLITIYGRRELHKAGLATQGDAAGNGGAPAGEDDGQEAGPLHISSEGAIRRSA